MGANILERDFARLRGILTYARMRADYLNMDAIYSDDTDNFVSDTAPERGGRVSVTLRVGAGNVDGAAVLTRGGGRAVMRLARSEGLFDYYAAELVIGELTRYSFEVTKGGRVYGYNRGGVCRGGADAAYDFQIAPGFETPEWAKGAVMYQIFVDRFNNGDEGNDPVTNEYLYQSRRAKKIEDWYAPVENDDVCNFYGGDLQGVIDKLGYLEDLGVQAIYLNPVFVSPSSHKYDMQDYDYIDPHFGRIAEPGGEPISFDRFSNRYASMYINRTTVKANLEAGNELFIRFVEAAHGKGIKVILDGVFNHCGAFHKWMDRENFYYAGGHVPGAYRDKDSPYKDYFRWYDDAWPNNECYDGWWGHSNHPKLYYEGSKELYDDIMRIARKWVSPPYNADGWRLDVAADVGYTPEFNHKFWRDFRANVKQANPEALILAEHYGDPAPWLDGGQWDSVMNYDAFMEPATWFLTGMEKHSERFEAGALNDAKAFQSAMRYFMSRLPNQALSVAMNELSNHDHSRFLTRTNKTAGRLHTHGAAAAAHGVNMAVMYEAVLLQMTWPGAPTVYYGDEAGMLGWTDPDNRRTFPWGRENAALLEFHKVMIRLRKGSEALRSGTLEYLAAERGVLAYGRRRGGESVVCAINNGDEAAALSLPVWRVGVPAEGEMRVAVRTGGGAFETDLGTLIVSGGQCRVTLQAKSAVVLVRA